ncbi:MAG: thiamine phosphate synthase [Phycisphaerales bacterium]
MNALARMIDANLNRAREALRVLEDVARLALDDAELSGRAKGLRHDLAGALRTPDGSAPDPLALLASRDTAGDVGTGIKAEGEGRRSGVRDVAVAAGKRLSEALRVLEEAMKTADGPSLPGAWESIESIRYRAYDLERDLVLALGTGRARQWRLCVLLSEELCARPWDEVAAEAIAGGADCLQLREKQLESRELLRRARWLAELCRGRATLIINDRPDLALLSGADGVHLGQSDLTVAEVRALAGSRLLVGVSSHDLDEARAAARAGADYCGVGAMFPTTTKAREVSGIAYLRQYLAEPALARVPHLAIGGVTPANVGELAAAGCRGVAVSASVCGAEEPGAVCAALIRALEGVGGAPGEASNPVPARTGP